MQKTLILRLSSIIIKKALRFTLYALRSRKPFAFRLLPFTSIAAFGFLLLALSSGCHLNPNKQTPGAPYLQGEWQQDSVPAQKSLVSYSLYNIKFSCDSFFMTIKSFSKVNAGSDTCMKSGRW